MTDITPARLAELIGFLQDRTDGGFGASGDVGNDTLAALRELESARTQLEGVSAGTHVIVPREPTQAMILSGIDSLEYLALDCEETQHIYRAMLAPEKEPAQENGNG